MVVIESPLIYNPAGVFQANEQLAIQEFVPEAAVKTLHVAVLLYRQLHPIVTICIEHFG